MMLIREIRTLVSATAASAIRNPPVIPLMMLVGVTAKTIDSWLARSLNPFTRLSAMTRTTRPIARPTTPPSRTATTV